MILADITKIQSYDIRPLENVVTEIKLKAQLSGLKICNFLMLAIELSTLIKNIVVMKRLLYELYEHLRPYLSYETKPPLVNHCILFCHQMLRLIPRDQMDSSMRRIGSCIAYEFNKDKLFTLSLTQEMFMHRLLLSEAQIEYRRWRIYTKRVMKVNALTPDQLAQRQEQLEMLRRGGDLFMIDEQDRIKEPEPYESNETFLVETEKEGKAYEEFMSRFTLEIPSIMFIDKKVSFLRNTNIFFYP